MSEIQFPKHVEVPKTRCDVVLMVASPEGVGSLKLELADDFDTVFNKMHPLSPPSSSLEARKNALHNLKDGGRVVFQPGVVAVLIEKDVEDD